MNEWELKLVVVWVKFWDGQLVKIPGVINVRVGDTPSVLKRESVLAIRRPGGVPKDKVWSEGTERILVPGSRVVMIEVKRDEAL